MNKFLHDFVMKTIKKMIDGEMEDYRIMQYALGWYEKQVLEQADLEQIETWLAEKEAEKVAVIEQPTEETLEEMAEQAVEEAIEEIAEEMAKE